MERSTLPVELLCQVLYLLNVDDLLRCSAASKLFHSLVHESSRLQFTLELAKQRMISLLPPTEFPPFSTRLKLIRDRERNWRSPKNWGALKALTLPPTGTVYEFVGGYYANGWEDENKVTSGISFFELPSTEPTTSNAPLKTWTHPLGSIKIADFTMDPAQDLLVLVALAPLQHEYVYQVLLRSFTTNEPHPESSLPMGVLPCLPKITDHIVSHETTGAVRVQVARDLVALLVKEVHDSVSAHLQIWNWRYGSHHSCSMTRMAGIEDFTFLSDNTFLIVRPSGRFECYTFENPISCNTSPTLKSSYSLPQLQDGYMYWYICMSSNPAPGYVPPRKGTENRVYYPRPEERIHACCLYIFKPTGPGDHHVHSFVFFLNVKMFLDAPVHPPKRRRDNYPIAPYATSDTRLADAVTSSVPPSSTIPQSQNESQSEQAGPVLRPSSPQTSVFTTVNIPQQLPTPAPPIITRSRQMHLRSLLFSSGVQPIPWEEWGPQNTRWFDEALSTDWQHALYGLKTIECIDPLRPNRGMPVRPAELRTRLREDDGIVDDVVAASRVDPLNLPTVNDLLNGRGFDVGDRDDEERGGDSVKARPRPPHLQRHLRIRDYNPYALRREDLETDADEPTVESKGKRKAFAREQRRWMRRIVTAPSIMPSRGVFVKDISSALPYSEVISKEKYSVTDVMMDDCRVLLMQVSTFPPPLLDGCQSFSIAREGREAEGY
ncbi:hypothetical protein GGX14DRAFT_352853 [Mycena pura]|uniref:F-box domain-containing protein n=1 Tax=Mycena pura TaxID=153505 RepID=A0AAD7E054_9AGAR|nr:hypothetical protein GGX14DRAFT_352853 [Mycena pura]